MKKLILTVAGSLLAVVLITFLLEKPVAHLLTVGGIPSSSALSIALVAAVLLVFLFLDRRRIRRRRMRRREARLAWKEQERIRNSAVMSLTPLEYEEYVAQLLLQNGYTDVHLTPPSGDFGADVLARDGNRTVCVQCKQYAPGHLVGVKAVQEVYAAKDYYGCDDACIYTTSRFTKAAVEMAAQLRILLVTTEP